jgi:26S proteasome regulatory subunit T6
MEFNHVNACYASVRLLREELQLLHEPGSYVGEVVKLMGKNKVLVKVQPEGKYSTCASTYPYITPH